MHIKKYSQKYPLQVPGRPQLKNPAPAHTKM